MEETKERLEVLLRLLREKSKSIKNNHYQHYRWIFPYYGWYDEIVQTITMKHEDEVYRKLGNVILQTNSCIYRLKKVYREVVDEQQPHKRMTREEVINAKEVLLPLLQGVFDLATQASEEVKEYNDALREMKRKEKK